MKKIYLFILTFVFGVSISFSQSVSNTLDFDGLGNYVAIPNGTALFANQSAFSMCGWVYPTNPNAIWDDFDGYFGIKAEFICDFYIAQINGTGLEARITTTNGTSTLNPSELSQVTVNEWQHFALVYDGAELKLYFDGVLDGSVAATGTIAYENLELTIGMLDFENTDFFLDGKVDEVTFWSKALTESEVNDYMCISGDPSTIDDLVGYYDFNEESGLILPDFFNNYNGNLTNMTGNEWIESEVCDSGFDITFVVTELDGTTPVQDASVDLDGVVKQTNEYGIAVYSNYEPGTYFYTVMASGYWAMAGEIEVVDEDITVNVLLPPVVLYDIIFNVTQDPGGAPIDSAIVNVDGIIQYTDETGQTTFIGYLPGTYSYFVSKDGYTFVAGDVEVVDEDVSVDIVLVITGVESTLESNFVIYPVPSDGKICIQFEEDYIDNIDVSLTDLSGKIILNRSFKEKEKINLDLSVYNSGSYIVQIQIEDRLINRLIILD